MPSFRWSTDPCVFISYSFCLIHKGSEFKTVCSAKYVTSVMIAQSREAVYNSTDKMVMLALAMASWVNSMVPEEFIRNHQSSCCVSLLLLQFTPNVPSDSIFCWKAKPGCEDSCFSKHDTRHEAKLRASQCAKLFYASIHNLFSGVQP